MSGPGHAYISMWETADGRTRYALLPNGRYDGAARTSAAALPLVERFSKTLLCNDCNAADAAMKAAFGKEVNPAFSFSPSEITSFVIPKSNASHELHKSRGAQASAPRDPARQPA